MRASWWNRTTVNRSGRYIPCKASPCRALPQLDLPRQACPGSESNTPTTTLDPLAHVKPCRALPRLAAPCHTQPYLAWSCRGSESNTPATIPDAVTLAQPYRSLSCHARVRGANRTLLQPFRTPCIPCKAQPGGASPHLGLPNGAMRIGEATRTLLQPFPTL